MKELTEEQVEAANIQIKKGMCFELLEMSLIVDPATVFGAKAIKDSSDFLEIFNYINFMRQKLTTEEFQVFYDNSISTGKSFFENGLGTELGSQERADQADLAAKCEGAFNQLTAKEQAIYHSDKFKIDQEAFDKLFQENSELSEDTILKFFRKSIHFASV